MRGATRSPAGIAPFTGCGRKPRDRSAWPNPKIPTRCPRPWARNTAPPTRAAKFAAERRLTGAPAAADFAAVRPRTTTTPTRNTPTLLAGVANLPSTSLSLLFSFMMTRPFMQIARSREFDFFRARLESKSIRRSCPSAPGRFSRRTQAERFVGVCLTGRRKAGNEGSDRRPAPHLVHTIWCIFKLPVRLGSRTGRFSRYSWRRAFRGRGRDRC